MTILLHSFFLTGKYNNVIVLSYILYLSVTWNAELCMR